MESVSVRCLNGGSWKAWGDGGRGVTWGRNTGPSIPAFSSRFQRRKSTVRGDAAVASAALVLDMKNPNPISNQDTLKKKVSCVKSLAATRQKQRANDPVGPDTLDDWVYDSIYEIVRNIGEAPFLMHIYSKEEDGPSSTMRFEREKVVPEIWPCIKRRWDEEGNHKPDGVILVEQLDYDCEKEIGEVKTTACCGSSNNNSLGTRLWGILIQGRGSDRSACYILKTCRVNSSIGFCTHFCLVRAQCFGKAPDLQIGDMWLVR